MKHLLNGVAIAAALAIAAPAWAQAPMTPSSSGAPKAAAAPAATAAPTASKQRHKRTTHAARKGKMAPGEMMTEQLNREELARLQGGGGPPPPPPPAQQGPRAGALAPLSILACPNIAAETARRTAPVPSHRLPHRPRRRSSVMLTILCEH